MKKILALILTAVLCLGLFAGCSKPGNTYVETRIVTDTWGREVEIPAKVETIVCLGSGAPRMAAYLGVTGMMVGSEDHDIKDASVLRDYSMVCHEELKNLPAVGAGGGSGANNGYFLLQYFK